MTRGYRNRAGERGVALLAVILAILIMTAVVILLVFSAMGETTQAFDQLRGQQALAVAEAGAYRALAELRRRIEVDLGNRVGSVSDSTIRDICNETNGRRAIDMIAMFAYPVGLGASDWVVTGGDTATLTTGTVTMTDPGSGAVGQFTATIHVKPSGAPALCQYGAQSPEQETLWFDYAIRATGQVANARRSVCLRSRFADGCPDWDWSAPYTTWTNWQGSFTITGSHRGVPVFITKAPFSRWALMLLDVSNVWLYSGTVINGPVHSNNRIRIAGNPQLNDNVTQVDGEMDFRRCGIPTSLPIPAGLLDPVAANAALQTSGCDNTTASVFRGTVQGHAARVALPSNANPARTSTGIGDPNDTRTNPSPADISNNINATYRAGLAADLGSLDPNNLPDGLYVMTPPICAAPPCGGIYVQGDVQQMVLSSENDQQVIRLEMRSAPPSRRFMRVEINPDTRAVTVFWNCDRNATICQTSAALGANTFNGVFYVNGSITYATDGAGNPDSGASSGLYGVVNRRMRLTIAAEQNISITDVLVYEAPPAGPGHNTVNVLGLYARTGDVNVIGEITATRTGPVANNPMYVDAVVLAPNGRFQVTGIANLPDLGNLYHLGGTVQGTFGAFGQFVPDLRGYGRVMTYDWRLRSNVSPPFFPLTDRYAAPIPRFGSQEAVFINGDPLYDRPEWEEVVGS
ncbi:MAG: hypothetical protein QN178_01080 [Armatimonadota bacterium]|nr:hypothetical protein [Armatimonadota bacterium]